jgi:hypothetical protein
LGRAGYRRRKRIGGLRLGRQRLVRFGIPELAIKKQSERHRNRVGERIAIARHVQRAHASLATRRKDLGAEAAGRRLDQDMQPKLAIGSGPLGNDPHPLDGQLQSLRVCTPLGPRRPVHHDLRLLRLTAVANAEQRQDDTKSQG